MTGVELEGRLFTYYWLAMNTPNSHGERLRQLAEEAERRGQAAMVERAKLRARTAMAGDTGKPHERQRNGQRDPRAAQSHQGKP
jgi:hypothetical protein